MQIINEQDAQEDRLCETDTKDDLIVLAKAGLSTAGSASPIVWLVITAIVIVVVAVLPITIIALAFGAGHFSNWFLSDNNKNKR